MSMRSSNRFMTPCEALRQINDLCQSDSDKDKQIRKLLSSFEKMAKMLSREINSREGKKIRDDWWEISKLDWSGLARWRISDIYKSER